jgi:hypothetical protein
MTFVSRPVTKDIKAIRQGDPNFMINDGMVSYPRAMLHILPNCPREIRETVNWALAQGYIKPVAHVYGKELTMDALR